MRNNCLVLSKDESSVILGGIDLNVLISNEIDFIGNVSDSLSIF